MKSRLFVLAFFLLPAFSSGKGGRGGGGRGSSAGRSSSRGSSGSSGSRGRSGGSGHSWSTGGAAGGGMLRRLNGFSAPIRQHSAPTRYEIEGLKVALLASLNDPPQVVRESAVPSAFHKRPYYFISPKSSAAYSVGYVAFSHHSDSGDRCSVPMDDLVGSPRRLNNAFENLLRINYLDCFNNRSANGGDIEWYTRCFEEAKNPTTTTDEPRSAEDQWLLDMRLSDGGRPTEMVWRCPFREYCCGVDCCEEEYVRKTRDVPPEKTVILVVILVLAIVVCWCYVFAYCDKLKQKEGAGSTGADETETITTQPAENEQSGGGSEYRQDGDPSSQLMDGNLEKERRWTPYGNPPPVVYIHICDAKAPPPYDSNC
ncbi:hypothetical protein M3Y99_01954400 [Aphelenchoides fujianensis]|nr:hypothetical protein M3Y99_01954400 [Aphelenchoides fujianensis]